MNRTGEYRRSKDGLPQAKIQRSRFGWMFWLVPVGAVALCGWFFYRDVIASGPTITIFFKDADGLEEKNTLLKYRGANIGEVRSVELTKDHELVKVTARLDGSAAKLAAQGAIFWIVRPEVGVGEISGLNTIVAGEYIGVQPGKGAATNSFMGAEKEPITPEPGSLHIVLQAPNLSSLQELSPIFYRGIQVGETLYFQLAEDSRKVIIHARIRKDYAPLVRNDTKFWNAGGIDFRLGLFKGVQISAESPKTVFSGGIEFATPPEYQAPATNGTVFVLNEKAEDKWKAWEPDVKLDLPKRADQTSTTPGLNLK
jgi:paraquat-inducible protein B